MNDWKTYHEKLRNGDPRPILVEAASLCLDKIRALDIGAGSLNESTYLTSQGFAVTAIDPNFPDNLSESSIQVEKIGVEQYAFPVEEFNLVAALYTFPFLKGHNFEELMRKITSSLREDGIFVAQFFGKNDQWSKRCVLHTREEIEGFLTKAELEIVKLEEREWEGQTALNGPKHWHVFDLIARKL